MYKIAILVVILLCLTVCDRPDLPRSAVASGPELELTLHLQHGSLYIGSLLDKKTGMTYLVVTRGSSVAITPRIGMDIPEPTRIP